MAEQYRTVEYQGSRVNRDGGISVPSGQGALDSNAQYQQRQLQRSGEAIEQNNNLALSQARQLDQMEINRQQLVAQQMSSSNEAVLKAEDMYGRQQLANQELRNSWKNRVGELQLAQQISSDNLKQQISAQDTAALTQLGENIVQFSQTLWQAKAKDINRKNQELQSQGLMDELYGMGKTTGADVARVDQSQHSRLAAQTNSELVAQQQESAGRPNDAARIRADNPFYAYGRQEAMALKAATGIPSALEEAVQLAESTGALKKGDPQYNVALRMVIKDATRKYIIDNGLHTLPPAVARRYFAEALLEAETRVVGSANKANNAYVKEATGLVARNSAVLAYEEVGRNPAEGNKVVSSILARPGSMESNLDELFKDYTETAEMLGDPSGLEALMKHPLMAYKQGDYSAWKEGWENKTNAQMEKANQEYFENQKASFELELRGANPEDIPAIRERYLDLATRLPLKQRNQLEQLVSTARQGNYTSENIELDDVVRRSRPGEVAKNLEQWKKDNPYATPQAIQEADKLIKDHEATMQPWAKSLLEEFEGVISTAEDPSTSAAKALDSGYTSKVKEIKRRRTETLHSRFKVFMARLGGGASEDAVRQWWAKNNADLKAPIRPDVNGNFAELDRTSRLNPVTSAGPTVQRTQWNGRSIVDLTHPRDQELISKGQYGRINLQEGALVLRPDQLQQAVARFESGQDQLPLVKQAAAAANVTEEAFIRIHAKAYGLAGDLARPQDPRQTSGYKAGTANGTRVTRDYAVSFARSKNLSPRGALFFAQSIMDESGGDPNTVHDGGTGFGLWGARLDRADKMKAHARALGVPENDPIAQMDYALHEIKTFYPSYWNILKSANPTTNQLIRVSQGWLRYSEDLHDSRAQSLINVLGN